MNLLSDRVDSTADMQAITSNLSRLFRRPETWVILGAASVFLPWLGSSGLWDPWETHYAEVARRMVADGDWLTPRWRNELFFSKPAGSLWLMALSFSVGGLNAWAARLPFALIVILGVFLTYRFVARLTDSRRGLWAALVLAASPFYFFIARQAITDMPFAVFLLGSLTSFFVVAVEEQPRLRDVLGIYIFAALAALAKTPIGLAIPGAVAVAYLLLSGDWAVLKKMKLHWGIPVFLIIAAPWYTAMLIMYPGKFFGEFFMHHNIQRVLTGVHGQRGTFEYYIQQLGYGFFPWVALLPLAIGRIGSAFRKPETPATVRLSQPGQKNAALRLDLFLSVWFIVAFATFTLFMTKFHHYVFPALPPLAMLVGLALADDNPGGWRFLAPLGVLLLAIVANDLVANPAHLSNLAVYKYERPLPGHMYPRWSLLALSVLFGAMLVGSRWVVHRAVPGLLAGLGLLCALGLSWFYLAPLGHTMSQQDLFETYDRLAKPGEPLRQYQMNWRGEVFYSQDRIVKVSGDEAVQRLFAEPEKRAFIIAIKDSFGAVDRAVRRKTGKHLHILPGSNSRYVLASNQIEPQLKDLNPLSSNVLSKPPPITHPAKASWVKGVEFLGYELEPDQLKAGDEFDITLFFKCNRPLERNWQVFIHVDGHGHEFHRINGDHYPVEGMFPTNHWEPGDIIRDTLHLKVPIEFSATNYNIYLGFFIGEERMKLSPGAPSDGNDRLLAGKMKLR